MIVVQFNKKTSGTCGWCGKQKDELFDVIFQDKSFMGAYCTTDLLKAISMKIGVTEAAKPEARQEVKPAQAAVPVPAGNGPPK